MRASPDITRTIRHTGGALKTGLAAILLLSSCAGSKPVAREEERPAPDTEEVLRRLERNLGDVKTVQTSVTQVKELAVFSRKITLTGRIFLENPGKLAWHMDKPLRYSIVIDGTTMRQWDEDTDIVQKTSLSGNPVFKTVSDQLQKWFAGRYSSLRAEYEVEALRQEPAVALRFRPKPGLAVAKAMKQVTVTFRKDGQYLREISIEGVNGDKTTLTFSDTVLNKPIAADAWEVRPRDR